MSVALMFSIDWTTFRLVTAAGASLCCFVLACLAHRKNKVSPLNRSFAFFNLFLGLWNISDIAIALGPPSKALFFDRLSYVFGTLMVPHFLTMTLEFAGRPFRSRRPKVYLNVFILFLLSVTFTPWLIHDVKFDPYFIEVPGPLYIVFILYILGWMGYGVLQVLLAYRHSSGAKKNQLRYLALAFTILFGAAVAYITSMVNPEAPPVFYVLEASYNLIVGYTIIRYRLMDINLVFRNGTIFLTLGAIVGLPLLGIGYLVDSKAIWVLLLFFSPLFGSIVIPKLRDKITAFINQLPPFKGRYDQYREDFVQAKRESVINAASLQLWAQNLILSVKEILRVDKAAVLLYDGAHNEYMILYCIGLPELAKSPLALEYDSPLVQKLRGTEREFVLLDDLSAERPSENLTLLKNDMALFSAQACVALQTEGKLSGILMIGSKPKGEMFNHLDVGSLQHLKRSSEQALRALLSNLSQGEFVSSFAHDLMHPFGPKGSFQLIAQMMEDQSLKPEMRKKLSLILNEADYVWKHLGTVLNPAKYMKQDHPVLEDRPLTGLFHRTRIKYEAAAKKHGIRWTVEAPPESVLIHCDDEDLEHRAIVNLVDNAFRCVQEGGAIELGHRVEKDNLIVYVRDTGPGIPPDKLGKLFAERSQGTGETRGKAGWGLYNAKSVVEAIGGKISVDSEVGRGTTFFVKLPIAQSAEQASNSLR